MGFQMRVRGYESFTALDYPRSFRFERGGGKLIRESLAPATYVFTFPVTRGASYLLNFDCTFIDYSLSSSDLN